MVRELTSRGIVGVDSNVLLGEGNTFVHIWDMDYFQAKDMELSFLVTIQVLGGVGNACRCL